MKPLKENEAVFHHTAHEVNNTEISVAHTVITGACRKEAKIIASPSQ